MVLCTNSSPRRQLILVSQSLGVLPLGEKDTEVSCHSHPIVSMAYIHVELVFYQPDPLCDVSHTALFPAYHSLSCSNLLPMEILSPGHMRQEVNRRHSVRPRTFASFTRVSRMTEFDLLTLALVHRLADADGVLQLLGINVAKEIRVKMRFIPGGNRLLRVKV